jgi:hypothetical protein
MWNDLSMTERAKYIGLAVQSGITNPSIIRSRYNSFARGGYTKWKEAIQNYKGIQIDGDDTYDYVSFYNDDPDRAWDMLNKDSKSHFVDTYKTAKHPSFSVESKYSSSPDNLLNINKYNPLGITGGTWKDNDHTYQLSEDQFNIDWDTDRTYDYFKEAESNPVYIQAPDGANYLRSITVTPKSNKFEGGGRKYRVQGTQGTNYGEFNTKEEAEQYIANNNMEQYFEETLPEFTVTAKAPSQSIADKVGQFINDEILLNKDNIRVRNAPKIGEPGINIPEKYYNPLTLHNFSDKQIDEVNRRLEKNPAYFVLPDNGRYSHISLDSNVDGYVSPFDNADEMFVVGKRIKKK